MIVGYASCATVLPRDETGKFGALHIDAEEDMNTALLYAFNASDALFATYMVTGLYPRLDSRLSLRSLHQTLWNPQRFLEPQISNLVLHPHLFFELRL